MGSRALSTHKGPKNHRTSKGTREVFEGKIHFCGSLFENVSDPMKSPRVAGGHPLLSLWPQQNQERLLKGRGGPKGRRFRSARYKYVLEVACR